MDSFYLNVIRAFNTFSVSYIVVGGFAVNFHGYNRTTGDLDIWISKSDKNLQLLKEALAKLNFELPEEAITELKAERIITFSEDECVIELMTRLNISKSIPFDTAFERCALKKVNGLEVKVISLNDLIEEKSRSKRYKDLDDLSKLEEAKVYYGLKSKEE